MKKSNNNFIMAASAALAMLFAITTTNAQSTTRQLLYAPGNNTPSTYESNYNANYNSNRRPVYTPSAPAYGPVDNRSSAPAYAPVTPRCSNGQCDFEKSRRSFSGSGNINDHTLQSGSDPGAFDSLHSRPFTSEYETRRPNYDALNRRFEDIRNDLKSRHDNQSRPSHDDAWRTDYRGNSQPRDYRSNRDPAYGSFDQTFAPAQQEWPADRRYPQDLDRNNRQRDDYRNWLNRPAQSRYQELPAPGQYEQSRPRSRQFDNQFNSPVNERVNNYRPFLTTPVNKELSLLRTRMSARYQNPVNVRFLKSLSSNKALGLYDEISQVIDSRHLNPAPYATRVQRAVQHLTEAMNNDAFLRTNGLQNAGFKLDSFRHQLSRVNTSGIRSRDDARNVMTSLMRSAQDSLGISPTVVAYEFVASSTESLDKYSAFEPANRPLQSGAIIQEWKSVGLDDQIVGIGVEIKQHDAGLQINKTLKGGSAFDSGLRKGDIITSINGRNIGGMSLSEAADMISGPAGSAVMLGIDRNGTSRTMSLRRRSFKLLSINESHMLNDSVAYIKLDKFIRTSSEEMDQALRTLHKQGMKSLVMDLRGNPGGLLDECVEICNKFVPCGTIVSTRGRLSSDNSIERATYSRTWSTPIVVLTDGNSASASEIFAAAIQDNGRGVILGEKSYGKGTVQTHFPMQTVAGTLRLTTAKFYAPSGREMAGSGVTPDVMVSTSEDSQRDAALSRATQIAGTRQLSEMAQNSAKCRTRSGSLDGMFPAMTSTN